MENFFITNFDDDNAMVLEKFLCIHCKNPLLSIWFFLHHSTYGYIGRDYLVLVIGLSDVRQIRLINCNGIKIKRTWLHYFASN